MKDLERLLPDFVETTNGFFGALLATPLPFLVETSELVLLEKFHGWRVFLRE